MRGQTGMLKVCFLGGARYNQPLEKTSEKKFQALKAFGELFVIGFSQNLRPRRFTEHSHFYLLPAFPLPVLRYMELLTAGMLLACWLIFRHGVQVLVAQSPYEGFSAAWAKKIAGWFGRRVVLVVENHGDFQESLFMQRRVLLPKFYRFLMRHAASFALARADVLRSISNSTKSQLERWIPGKEIIQFPTWTDIEVFLRAGLIDKEHSLHEILYVGVLIPRKGVHYLINAFAHIGQDFLESRLVIVGRAENASYTADLKEQVRRLSMEGRVQFVGEVPQIALATWMRRACVFVLPSMSEGLGRVVVEAMATGTPVIGSNVGGIPEMVDNGITGFLVPPGDEAALVERLRWVLEHPHEARDIGHNSRAFAERFFSTAAYIRGYGKVFEAAHTLLAEQDEHAHSTI
jgi:glycosyltransferase involved in cell wall biosynthesis